MRINLTTPLSDDKERQRRNEVILAEIERHTEERMNDEYGRIHTDGSRSGGQPVLKPCPFCGGVQIEAFHHIDRGWGASWHVECVAEECGNSTCHHDTEATAIAAWNKRQPTQSDALLEGDAQTILYLLGVRHGREDERAKIAAETRQPAQSDVNERLGAWLSAALDDPNCSDAFKQDINDWFANQPTQSDALRIKLLEDALLAVVEATRAYLPPDGIDAKECLSRILGATDNPTINPIIFEIEGRAALDQSK
jgi:Lar family restriction alleviation protein